MQPTRVRFRVVACVVLLAMITYLDRACLGILAPEIRRDLGLSLDDMSAVFGAFALAYALFELPTARWADRRGTRLVLTRIVAWWSVFTMATGAAFNLSSMLATRFLFGAGEAGAWPCVARTFSRWIPQRDRGTAKGVFFAGAYISAGVTPFVATWLLRGLSWRQIFLCFGLTGVAWGFAWHRWFRDEPGEHPAVNAAERELIHAGRAPSSGAPRGWAFWKRLLLQRNMAALCLMYLPNSVTSYFCFTWLPTYLHERHGFDAARLGFLAGLPLLLSVATQFLGGFFSDLVAARFGLRAGRRAPGVIGYGGAALAMVAAAGAATPIAAAVWLALAVASCMFTTAAAWGTCVDIGREHSAVVSAVMNTASQIGAIVSPFVVTYSVRQFASWDFPLYLLGGLFVLGAACWFAIDPTEPAFAPDQ